MKKNLKNALDDQAMDKVVGGVGAAVMNETMGVNVKETMGVIVKEAMGVNVKEIKGVNVAETMGTNLKEINNKGTGAVSAENVDDLIRNAK